MIRLPPSGISISQNDLTFHLQHLDIYYGLLKQGFKKKEIMKYFDEQKASRERERERSFDGFLPAQNHSPPSLKPKGWATDLCRKAISDASILTRTPEEEEFQGKQCNARGFASPLCGEIDASMDLSSTSPSNQCNKGEEQNLESSDVVQSRSLSHTHVPRRSSLLRFSQNVSSDSFENNLQSFVAFPPTSEATHHAHSDAGSYEQSEPVVSGRSVSQGESLGEELEHLSLSENLLPTEKLLKVVSPHSSSLSPLAEEFSPLRLPPLFAPVQPSCLSGAVGTSPGHQEGRDRGQRLEQTDDSLFDSPFTITTSHMRSAEPYGFQLPSSPPVIPESSHMGEYSALQSSPSIAMVPITPRLVSSTNPRTEPRHGRSRYLDGAFTVYDDSQPASLQPQTPADLTNSTVVSEYNAAYTAPPGMVRSEFARQGHLMHHLRQVSGEQSPTSRALIIRSRRQREFVRSVQVEGLRIGRVRRRHVAEADTSQVGPDEEAGPGLQESFFEIWRDDLDADRVGEENFESIGLAEAGSRGGIRAFSGNQRVAS